MSVGWARYLFKLRRNIVLEGDVALAGLELASFFPRGIVPTPDLYEAAEPGLRSAFAEISFLPPGAFARATGQQGYAARGPLTQLPVLVRRLSFVQTVYCVTADTPAARERLAEAAAALGPVLAWRAEAGRLFIAAIPHYTLIEFSAVVARRVSDPAALGPALDLLLAALLGRTREAPAAALARTALLARSSTAHLSHDLHYYKAKFFPRMARALLNVCAERLGPATPRAFDNFSGSGTTLLEAALLGMPSVGLDIDPLSTIIARAKLDLLSLDSHLLACEQARVAQGLRAQASARGGTLPDGAAITFPAWLMKNRRMSPEIASQLAAEIAVARAALAGGDPRARVLLRVLLSDAIARKVRMRFLGTGVGRFALAFGRMPVRDLLVRSLRRAVLVAATVEWLRSTLHVQPAPAQAVGGDARCLPVALGTFDLLVTSPPYLPASSGRESYARARAPSLIALGMHDHVSVDRLVDDTIGSMDGSGVDLALLTQEELRIVEWLRTDALRAIKADPTARYFLDMRQAFTQMYQVLRPGACAVVVSGKTSTFYTFASRAALYVVPVAELLADEAARAGFTVEALYDIQLQKANRNARPRSLDAYYETLIVLRRGQ
jgi:DNA modification methylase